MSCFSILLSIRFELFISGFIELGSLDLTYLLRKRSLLEPVPSWEEVEFIANTISSRCKVVRREDDLCREFFSDCTALLARLLLWG